MKTLATVLTTICIWFAGVQWWQIAYRLYLFYRDYGGERYANHVDDEVFVVIHVVNVVLLFAAVFAAGIFWRAPGMWRWCAICVAAANGIAWLTFVCMHATGVLVGYSEFIQHRMQK